MLDEAQDSNPVILGVLNNQKCPVIYVGDPYQQIYEWRGAVNAMDRVNTPHRALLSQSFRFGERIASAATQVLQRLNAEKPLLGRSDLESHIADVHPRAVLSRTNASVMENLLQLQSTGIRCHVVGGSSELTRLLEHVSRLKSGIMSDLPEFFGFKNWSEVVAFSEEPEGEHLGTFVRLVTKFDHTSLMAALKRCESDEHDAQVCLSTAHRAKGKEWDHVRLSNDFDVPFTNSNSPTVQDSEVRLFYVAMTRGMVAVELPAGCREYFGIAPTSPYRFGDPLMTKERPTVAPSLMETPKSKEPARGIAGYLKRMLGI
jgi:superfamily I DNA/RNA helicase